MPKTREKVNPATEFKHDSMMREIHENRLKRYEEMKHKNILEKLRLIKERASKFRHENE